MDSDLRLFFWSSTRAAEYLTLPDGRDLFFTLPSFGGPPHPPILPLSKHRARPILIPLPPVACFLALTSTTHTSFSKHLLLHLLEELGRKAFYRQNYRAAISSSTLQSQKSNATAFAITNNVN